jgi:hypothetical protein
VPEKIPREGFSGARTGLQRSTHQVSGEAVGGCRVVGGGWEGTAGFRGWCARALGVVRLARKILRKS